MRPIAQAALVIAALFMLPLAVATVAASPPSGFTPISASDFHPVVVPPLRADEVVLPQPSATLSAPVIFEPVLDLPDPTLAARVQPEAVAGTISKETPKPAVIVAADTGRSRSGTATWYCRAGVSVCHYKFPDTSAPDDYFAAAGPALRVGDWRGRVVTVCSHGGARCIPVRLVDFCACMNGETGRIIDLYWDAFNYLSDGRGGESVVVSW